MQTINEYQITHVALPPSALAAMSNQSLPSLQAIIVAGEACATELAAQWSRKVRFFNAYAQQNPLSAPQWPNILMLAKS